MTTMDINIIKMSIIMKEMTRITKLLLIFTILFVTSSCTLSPGMKEPEISFSWSGTPISDSGVEVKKITSDVVEESFQNKENYKISSGDVLSIVVFGLNEYFPITYSGINNPYTSKLVDEKGFIFFHTQEQYKFLV